MCEVSSNCMLSGISCWHCKYSDGLGVDNNYRPSDASIIHPQLIKAKQEYKNLQKMEKYKKKNEKDKEKVALLKKAAKVENLVKSTLNSGRINRDSDLIAEHLTIDVKLQSTRENPVINVDEFIKVQNDARRAGKLHGVLAIQNKSGKRFYVVSEELFREVFI